MGLRSHFAVLASDIMDSLAGTVRDAGLPLGVGGVGRVGDQGLPIATDLVYAQLARLGATRALISRAFFPPDPLALDLDAEVDRLRERLGAWHAAPRAHLDAAREQLRMRVRTRFAESPYLADMPAVARPSPKAKRSQ
jgi:hypothetical protein